MNRYQIHVVTRTTHPVEVLAENEEEAREKVLRGAQDITCFDPIPQDLEIELRGVLDE